MTATAATGATQIQPSGKALPSLITGSPPDREAHLTAARNVNPTATLLSVTLTPAMKEICNETVFLPQAVITKRKSALETLTAVSKSLGTRRWSWTDALPEGSPARNLNFPLIHCLIRTFGFDDHTLTYDLSYGMPITGHIPESGSLPTRPKPEHTSYEEWKAGIPTRNAEIIKRMQEAQGSDLSNTCWGKTLREVSLGWLSEPTPLDDTTAATIQLTPRFAKNEQHGTSAQKVRLLDDFKVSGINSMLDTAETSVPDSLDVFLSLATYTKSIQPECDLKAASVDFKHAYKHIGISPDQAHLATLLLAPPTGPLMTAKLRTQPFGSARAPANWRRVTNFVKWLLSLLFRINLCVYVDDCFIVECAATIQSAYDSIHSVCALLGLVLEPSKSTPPTDCIQLLGASITIRRDHISACLPVRKQNEWTDELRKILARNSLTAAQAAKIRGKLGFATSLMFGKFGRAHLAAFSNRQYSPSPRSMLNDELREVIPWWIGALSCSIPRRVSFSPLPPLIVYTDASGVGHIGAVLFDGASSITTHTHLPPWLLREHISVYEMECAGVLFGTCLAIEHNPNRPILICCDNQGTNGAVIRGSCKTAIGRALISCIWTTAAANNVPVWIEYVNTKLNWADPPSRNCHLCETPSQLGANFPGVPASFHRILKTKADLMKCRFENGAVTPSFIDPWPCPPPQASSQ